MKRLGKRFASVFVILFLVLVSGTPQGAVFAQSAEYSWAEDIPAMLAKGNYAEGELAIPADVRTEDIADLTSLQWSSSDTASFGTSNYSKNC